MKNAKPIDPLDIGRFTAYEMRAKLASAHGLPDGHLVPAPTFRSWRGYQGIRPNSAKLYSQNQLRVLRSMVRAMRSGLRYSNWVEAQNAADPEFDFPRTAY